MKVKDNRKIKQLTKCALIVAIAINDACIDDPPPNMNPDSPLQF